MLSDKANWQPTTEQYYEVEQYAIESGNELEQARQWAKAWKQGAKHYKGLFDMAVNRGIEFYDAVDGLIKDIEAGGPSSLDILSRLYDIRREYP